MFVTPNEGPKGPFISRQNCLVAKAISVISYLVPKLEFKFPVKIIIMRPKSHKLKFQFQLIIIYTLPETNLAPKKDGFQ